MPMDPDLYQRLKELVQRALDLEPEDRRAYLRQACGSDETLYDGALSLLNQDVPDDDDAAKIVADDLHDLEGRAVGPYQIERKIGEGGMGIVYLATQRVPLRRRVALKVIKLGMDTREVVSRFESERQALALMAHPCIATVLDAGSTAAGRPYFVMEYIDGVPFTRYCREHHYDLRQRLDLFVHVCRGVSHAHLQGVIHRDLKPGNILVTEVEGRPVPKIIDFGVAKATRHQLSEQSTFTQPGRMVGTPEYMSPEQASGTLPDVDTRSDVYSLGVVLYELLTGELPIGRNDLLHAGRDRIGEAVRERVPRKPSSRISDAPEESKSGLPGGSSHTRFWARRVTGDLDWITMKALEKERSRRYQSVADLADDIVRHLEHRAVGAGPPSGVYRVKKFVRRNRLGVSIAAVLLLLLVGFGIWQTLQSRTIARERNLAVANERLSLARGWVERDPTVALAYALSSLEILDQPGTREVVRQAIASGPIRDEFPRWGQRGNPITVDASSDGRLCAVAWSQSEHPTVGIYDLNDLTMRVLTDSSRGIVYEAVLNADASQVIGKGEGGLHVWRVANGEHRFHLPEIQRFATSRIFRLSDPDLVAICGNDKDRPTRWFTLHLSDGRLSDLGESHGALRTLSLSHAPAIDPTGNWVLDYDGRDVFLQRLHDPGNAGTILVGRHNAPISGVAMDGDHRFAAAADLEGTIEVWDLTVSPPRSMCTYQERPGEYFLEFDPTGERLFSAWGSESLNVYDFMALPPRQRLQTRDRTQWTHDGSFLPDGSVLAARNGVATGPLARWRLRGPVAWRIGLVSMPGAAATCQLAQDGQTLFTWSSNGEIRGIPLAAGVTQDIGLIGRVGAHYGGLEQAFLLDTRQRRGLVLCQATGGALAYDFATSSIHAIAGLADDAVPMTMSTSGKLVGCVNLEGDLETSIVDLDSLRVVATIELGNRRPESLCFAGDSLLVACGDDHLARFDLKHPLAAPDTLWRGDASRWGVALDEARSLAVVDAELNLTWIDLTSARHVPLGTLPSAKIRAVDYDPAQGLLAVGGWWDTIHVFDVTTGTAWQLPAPGEGRRLTSFVAIDPGGRWLISVHKDQFVAWSLPLDPLFTDLDCSDLLARLRAATNVRVFPDRDQADGFDIRPVVPAAR